MALIKPITLRINRNPNNGKYIVGVNYIVSAGPNDAVGEQHYREVCQLIGDDTPGDGTDDVLHTFWDATLVFDGIFSHIQRGFQLEFTRSELDEDGGSPFPQDDEIRARVSLTPVAAMRESNQIVMAATGPIGSSNPS